MGPSGLIILIVGVCFTVLTELPTDTTTLLALLLWDIGTCTTSAVRRAMAGVITRISGVIHPEYSNYYYKSTLLG